MFVRFNYLTITYHYKKKHTPPMPIMTPKELRAGVYKLF